MKLDHFSEMCFATSIELTPEAGYSARRRATEQQESSVSGLREKGKGNNIRKIISAAEFLIKLKKSTDFTMIELANAANVSTFTTHNLIGTKSSVLFMLLIKHLDDIKIPPLQGNANDLDTIKYFLCFGDAPVDMYLNNEDYYRPLIGYLMGASTPGLRSEYIRKAWRYWIHAVSYLSQRKLSVVRTFGTTRGVD